MPRNDTQKSLDDVIDKLQDALEDARRLPDWSLTLIILIGLLCIVILIHVLALLTIGPCLYGMWLRRKRSQRDRLLAEDESLEEVVELAPSPDTAASEENGR